MTRQLCKGKVHDLQVVRLIEQLHSRMPLGLTELRRIHHHGTWHRKRIEQSERCGCSYCLEVFPPSAIEDWTDDRQTAICPHCGIDSVLPDDITGAPLTKEMLGEMQAYWFAQSKPAPL